MRGKCANWRGAAICQFLPDVIGPWAAVWSRPNMSMATADWMGRPLPEPVMPVQSTHAVDFIIDTLRAAAPKTITLCPLGPLTNIATALQRAPDIAERIAQIVLMGGAYFEVGNITPAAEFNIYVDPEAAQLVFESGVDLVVAPLDVTHKALTSPEWSAALRGKNHPICEVVAGWTEFFETV